MREDKDNKENLQHLHLTW